MLSEHAASQKQLYVPLPTPHRFAQATTGCSSVAFGAAGGVPLELVAPPSAFSAHCELERTFPAESWKVALPRSGGVAHRTAPGSMGRASSNVTHKSYERGVSIASCWRASRFFLISASPCAGRVRLSPLLSAKMMLPSESVCGSIPLRTRSPSSRRTPTTGIVSPKQSSMRTEAAPTGAAFATYQDTSVTLWSRLVGAVCCLGRKRCDTGKVDSEQPGRSSRGWASPPVPPPGLSTSAPQPTLQVMHASQQQSDVNEHCVSQKQSATPLPAPHSPVHSGSRPSAAPAPPPSPPASVPLASCCASGPSTGALSTHWLVPDTGSPPKRNCASPKSGACAHTKEPTGSGETSSKVAHSSKWRGSAMWSSAMAGTLRFWPLRSAKLTYVPTACGSIPLRTRRPSSSRTDLTGTKWPRQSSSCKEISPTGTALLTKSETSPTPVCERCAAFGRNWYETLAVALWHNGRSGVGCCVGSVWSCPPSVAGGFASVVFAACSPSEAAAPPPSLPSSQCPHVSHASQQQS